METVLDTPLDAARRDPIAAELAGLGMSAVSAAVFRAAASAPSGLVLIAGAAGSGRSTTLDAAHRIRGRGGVVRIDEINGEAAGDHAVRSALAGKFVLAAIDADGAVEAIERLRRMRVDPFLLAVALSAVFGQRLVRRLCPSCRQPVQASRDVSARLGFDPGTIVYLATGCAACRRTGYDGSIGLFEAIEVDPVMRRLIERGDAPIISGQAFRSSPDLGGAARAMVKVGSISAEDALAVSRPGSQIQ